MECDAVHISIEQKTKNKEIFLSSQYAVLSKEARPKQPYIVECLSYEFFEDYTQKNIFVYDSIRPGRTTNDPTVTDLRVLQYNPNGIIKYNLSFDAEYQELPRGRTRRRVLMIPENLPSRPKLYQSAIKIAESTKLFYLYHISSDIQSVSASHSYSKMKFLVIFAVLAVSSASVVGRDKRSFGLHSPAVYTTNTQYVTQEVSPVYRAVSTPVLYKTYQSQPVSYVSYPTTYTASVPQVYSSPVYTQTSPSALTYSVQQATKLFYLYQISSDIQSVRASHSCSKMKCLVIFAVLAVSSASVVGRDKRSFGLYSPAVYTTNQQYVTQEVSPVYRAVSTPVLYKTYQSQPVSYVSYPTTYTASVPQVYSSPVYTQTSQVAVPGVYDAEHSSQTSSISHYKLKSPSAVTYSVQQATNLLYLYQISSDIQSVSASHSCSKMKCLVIFAVLAVSSASVVGRDKRSFGLYSPAVYTTNQQYVTQGVASPVYRAVSTPVLYKTYQSQPVSYVSYPTTYTASVPQVYSSPVYTQTSQVAVPGLYDAEHSSQTSSISHYKVQSPSTVTYSVQQVPRTEYVVSNVNDPWC
ncbi:unnamed protein product [Parnassius apollo]|uniref:(apollo) hypothetical protein n=1 Tax=Parnassius apollo TaxID=110799 RepID=A0A8S3VZD4_PARAO|nr:unnamed protein product [Parnassius apollo]